MKDLFYKLINASFFLLLFVSFPQSSKTCWKDQTRLEKEYCYDSSSIVDVPVTVGMISQQSDKITKVSGASVSYLVMGMPRAEGESGAIVSSCTTHDDGSCTLSVPIPSAGVFQVTSLTMHTDTGFVSKTVDQLGYYRWIDDFMASGSEVGPDDETYLYLTFNEVKPEGVLFVLFPSNGGNGIDYHWTQYYVHDDTAVAPFQAQYGGIVISHTLSSDVMNGLSPVYFELGEEFTPTPPPTPTSTKTQPAATKTPHATVTPTQTPGSPNKNTSPYYYAVIFIVSVLVAIIIIRKYSSNARRK